MYTNKVLSKGMQVPELKEGEFAVFTLEGHGKTVIAKDLKGNPIYNGGSQLLEGKQTVYDRYEGKPVLIGNVTSSQHFDLPNGTTGYKYKVSSIFFPRTGSIMLDHTKNVQYTYMMRMNENGSNPFRDKGSKILFYLEDAKSRAIKDAFADEMDLEARLLIRDADAVTLKTLAKGVNMNPDREISLVISDLKKLAKTPEGALRIIKASDKEDLKTKVTIQEGEDLLFIRFDKDRDWSWMKDGKKILSVGIEEDKTQALIEHFKTKAGENKLRQLQGLLENHGA